MVDIQAEQEALLIGKWVRRVRLQKNLSEEKVGELSGLSPDDVAVIENGDAEKIDIQRVAKICDVLDLSINELIERVESELKLQKVSGLRFEVLSC